MMWNWFTKMLGIRSQPQRKRVQIEIPMEQHEYRGDFQRQPAPDEQKSETKES